MRRHDDQLTCSLKEEGRHPSRDVLRAAAKPAGDSSAALENTHDSRCDNLAKAIHQRIASRAQGRIHDLNVRIQGQTVVLSGHCATYYSKQLAQHAAQGIIDNEHLENEIHVVVPR
jgi:osmotically-inducible protein OsmY